MNGSLEVPARAGHLVVERAEAAFRAGDLARAAAETERILAGDPEHAHALLILGAVEIARRRHAAALTHTDRAIALWDAGDVPAALWHNRGIALAGLGRLDDAVEPLGSAVRVSMQHRQYRTSLAMVLHAAGTQARAVEVALGAPGAPENVVAAAVAFEHGDVRACRQIVDQARAGFDAGLRDQLDATQWSELQKYHAYLDRLLTQRPGHPGPPGSSRAPLWVVGDSHSLSPARLPLRFLGGRWVARPRLVFGLKAWHLARHRRGEPNLYASAFLRALDAIPAGATAVLSAGEIDCRMEEGFMPLLRRNGGTTPVAASALVAPVIADAIACATSEASLRGITLHIANIPAPHPHVARRTPEDADALAAVVHATNEAIEAAATAAGCRVVDVYRETVGTGGFARAGVHLDGVHVMPSVFGRATASVRP